MDFPNDTNEPPERERIVSVERESRFCHGTTMRLMTCIAELPGETAAASMNHNRRKSVLCEMPGHPANSLEVCPIVKGDLVSW
jgi:hypothetical protein